MIRYWKIISITLIIVLTIGTFYIRSAMAGNDYPEFVFDKQSGNENEVVNLTLLGDFRVGVQGNPLEISSEETVYANELSFFERLRGIYMSAELERLQNSYRNFMRGKDNISGIFEDEKRLVYVDTNGNYVRDRPREYTFDIEILEKDSKDKLDFTVTIPEKNKYNYVYMEDVQVLDNVMKVTTVNHSVNGNGYGSEEIHVYSLDIANQKLVNDEVIQLSPEQSSGQNSYMYLVQDESDIGLTTYLVFKKEYMEEVEQADGNYYNESIGSELITYHLASGEQRPIPLPEEINTLNSSVYLDDSIIYIDKTTDQGIKVSMFNLESQEIETSKTIKLPANLTEPLNTKIMDGKLYVVGYEVSKNTKAPLLVIDVETGKTLFEGIIETKNLEENHLEYEMNIYDMDLK
ncbi:hypothetical protein [Oceanobacillus rekensis]|uniref:hypothetical protein n=1 Tax=Oceanobacillus rekensis TaxID=937927 RepID=UPI000B4551D4|nr:hypothetical protein [Oceanobacillus rekensis]